MKRVLLSMIVLSLTMAACGCMGGGQPDNTPLPTSPQANETEKGLSLSPENYQEGSLEDFFQKAAASGRYVSWAGNWSDLGSPGSAPYVVSSLSETYEYIPIILVSTPLDENENVTAEQMEDYALALSDFAESEGIPYMAIGVEANTIYERDEGQYYQYVALFSLVAQKIRERSPGTKVMVVFQLERMKGLHGGLFGDGSNEEDAEWHLIDDFGLADIVAFTTYPCLVEGDPSLLPEDYYVEILSHTSKETAIVESGWFRNGPPGWESSAQEQAEYVERLFALTEGLSPNFIIWSFLYDQDVQYPFDSMGLLAADDDTSPAWEAWLDQE